VKKGAKKRPIFFGGRRRLLGVGSCWEALAARDHVLLLGLGARRQQTSVSRQNGQADEDVTLTG